MLMQPFAGSSLAKLGYVTLMMARRTKKLRSTNHDRTAGDQVPSDVHSSVQPVGQSAAMVRQSTGRRIKPEHNTIDPKAIKGWLSTNREFEEQISARKPSWLEGYEKWLPGTRRATIEGMTDRPSDDACANQTGTGSLPVTVLTKSVQIQSAVAVNIVHDWEDRKLQVGQLEKYARRRASDGDVPMVVDPGLSSPDIASSERKRQGAPISRRCIEISLLWFWERCIRELGFWWFAKRVVGVMFTTLFVLAVIPVLVPTKHATRIARLTDAVPVTFCSIPVNHHMCSIICAAPQAANVFMSVCDETSHP